MQGFPLTALSFSFVSVMWIMYELRILVKVGHYILVGKDIVVKLVLRIYITVRQGLLKEILFMNPEKAKQNHIIHDHKNTRKIFRIAISLIIISIVSYLYLLAFMVWGQLSYDDIQSHVDWVYGFNVPWYLYPMKFGLTGLLGLAFLLSYLFRKFEKEIFVFALVAVVAIFAGPYYDEHRFGKYVMVGMASLAALLICKLLNYHTIRPHHFSSYYSIASSNPKLRVLINGLILGAVISASGMSIFMFAGLVELFTNIEAISEDSRRDFPTQSEIQFLNFLQNQT